MRREVFYTRRQKEAVRFCRSASLAGEKFGLTAAEFRCTIIKKTEVLMSLLDEMGGSLEDWVDDPDQLREDYIEDNDIDEEDIDDIGDDELFDDYIDREGLN